MNKVEEKDMQVNVGGTDKILRIVAGLAIIGWGVMTNNWLGAIGIVPLANSVDKFLSCLYVVGIRYQ